MSTGNRVHMAKGLKRGAFSLLWLSYILLFLSACGGGGGGIGGGLIPGLMTMNTHAVLSNGSVQLTINGGLAPYSFSIYRGIGGALVAPFQASIDSSGLLTIDDIGDTLDYLIIKVVDDMNRIKYFRVPVLGKPATWLAADKIPATNIINGFVNGMPDQSLLGTNDASVAGDLDCLLGKCPQYLGSDALLNQQPSLYFDGTDDYMAFPSGISTDFTVALAYRSGAGGGVNGWATGNAMLRNSSYGLSLPLSGRISAGTADNITTSTDNEYNDNAGHIVCLTRDDGNVPIESRLYVDAGGIAPGAVGAAVGATTAIGSNLTYDGNFFLGAIPEIITYGRRVTDDERVVLTRYLKEKYGIPLPAVAAPVVTIDVATVAPGSSDANFEFTYTVSPYLDVEAVECRLDKAPATGGWSDCRNPDQFADNYAKAYAGLGDGDYTFYVRATDSDGTQVSASHNWVIDRSVPVCSITSPTSGSWDSSQYATVTFSCTDLSALTYECQVNGSGWGACTSPFDARKTGDPAPALGADAVTSDVTTVEVRATDSIGNGPSAVVSTTFNTDREDPTCTAIAGVDVSEGSIEDDTSESFTFSCSDAPATIPAANRVQCLLERNDSGWTTVSSGDCATDTTHLISSFSVGGEYRLTITVTDQAGKVSVPRTISWFTDLINPSCTLVSAPANGGYAAGNPTQSITFTCSDDTDPAPQARCAVSMSPAVPGDYADCTSPYAAPNGVEGTVYYFHVYALDHAARVGAVVSRNWTADHTAPLCTITTDYNELPAAARESGSSSIDFNCSDAVGLDRATCQVDGGAVVPCSSFNTSTGLGNHSFTVAGGSHTIDIIGYDIANQASVTQTENWDVDLSIPQCSIVDPANIASDPTPGLTINCADDLNLSPIDPVCTFENVTDSIVIANAIPCTGTVWGGAGPYTAQATYETPALTEGKEYRLTATITDTTGKTVTTPPTTSWIYDLTPPTCTIDSGPSGNVQSDAAVLIFSCTDPTSGGYASGVDHIECQVDGGGYSTCTSPLNLSGLADGAHTVQVQAVDSAGNRTTVGATPSNGWTSDITAPTIVGVSTSLVNATTRQISFTAADATTGLASQTCYVNSTPTACTTPFSYTVSAGNTYAVYVQVVDNVGNIETTTTVTEEVLGDGKTVAECEVLGDYNSHTFGGSGGDANLCVVENIAGATCPAPWTNSTYTTTIATSNIDVGGVDGVETTEAWAGVANCNSGPEPVSCVTAFHSWGTDAVETCDYDEGRPLSWNWSSYGNPDGVKTLLSGNIVDTGLVCPAAISLSEATSSLVDNDCTGNQYSPTAVPIYENVYRPTACAVLGTNEACCLQSCVPACTGAVETVTATITQRGCQ